MKKGSFYFQEWLAEWLEDHALLFWAIASLVLSVFFFIVCYRDIDPDPVRMGYTWYFFGVFFGIISFRLFKYFIRRHKYIDENDVSFHLRELHDEPINVSLGKYERSVEGRIYVTGKDPLSGNRIIIIRFRYPVKIAGKYVSCRLLTLEEVRLLKKKDNVLTIVLK